MGFGRAVSRETLRLRLGASAKLGVRSHFVGVERGGAVDASCCWEYTTIFPSSTSAGYMARDCFAEMTWYTSIVELGHVYWFGFVSSCLSFDWEH